MIFLFSENYDLGESREESETDDENLSNRLSSVHCSVRKTHPLACSFKATIEPPKKSPLELNKQTLQPDVAHAALESWKLSLKTKELLDRFGCKSILFRGLYKIFDPRKSEIKNEKSEKFHLYLREFDYVTVRTIFDLLYLQEAESVDLETILEVMIWLNFENQIAEKSNFEVKLLEDIIKVRFVTVY